MVWLQTITSVLIVSLISLIGIFFLSLKTKRLSKILIILVSFATGALFGDVFIHLIPEIAKAGFTAGSSIYILSGILMFFIIEKFVQWHHCHYPEHEHHKTKPLATMNLVGDGLHNFVDGMLIAGSYMVNFQLGMTTTIAVLLHEIPQEIGDFSILIYSGFSRLKALFYNFISALTAVIGAVFVLMLSSAQGFNFLIPFTAGGFIYIAGADLLPELHRTEYSFKNTLSQFLAIIAGILIMYGLLFIG